MQGFGVLLSNFPNTRGKVMTILLVAALAIILAVNLFDRREDEVPPVHRVMRRAGVKRGAR